MAGFSFYHENWPPQIGSSSSFDSAFTKVTFNRGNSQRKAANFLQHKENLTWNALPNDVFYEFKSFFEDRAMDGKAFWYQSPNDNKQRQWVIATDSSVSYQAINHEYSSLSVQLEEVFDA